MQSRTNNTKDLDSVNGTLTKTNDQNVLQSTMASKTNEDPYLSMKPTDFKQTNMTAGKNKVLQARQSSSVNRATKYGTAVMANNMKR